MREWAFPKLTPNPIRYQLGAAMLFEGKKARLQDVPWYGWLFYTIGIVAFFVLLLKQWWWYFGACNAFFLIGHFLLHKARKPRPSASE